MCGIVGFIGSKPAAPLLLEGLAKLEYRGYDSAGIALIDHGDIVIEKSKGRLSVLSERLNGGQDIQSTIGIGHTRWATHGKPSDENSHPHKSASGRFAVVHNGIIENYAALKKQLQDKGVEFLSETDTEVIAHLIEQNYTGDFLAAVRAAIQQLEGSYALGVLCSEHPDEFIAVRNASPLIVGLADIGNFIASDIPAVLAYTRRVIQLADHEIARLTRGNVEIFDQAGNPVEKQPITVDWDVSSAEKGGSAHFMIKEIMEQPQALSATISPRIDADGGIVLDGIRLTAEDLEKIDRIFIVACGSAYHAGVVGKYVIEKLARLPVEVDLASEFRYRDPIVDEKSLVIIISQSGETADTLAALRLCKERDVRTIGIVNVVGSSIAREADATMYTWAGPEISVATTKAYSTQLAACYLLATEFARVRGTLADGQYENLIAELEALPDKIEKILADKERIQWFASKYANAKDAFFIGRGLDYAVALEGSLKFKEISYIHSEAFAAGEMKHGPISLVENGTLVVGILTQPDLFEKSVSNMVEVKSRGAFLMGLTTYGNYSIEDTAGFTVYVPKTDPHFATSLAVIPLQLLAYYVSCAKGLDVDKPRNLAKSVTVE